MRCWFGEKKIKSSDCNEFPCNQFSWGTGFVPATPGSSHPGDGLHTHGKTDPFVHFLIILTQTGNAEMEWAGGILEGGSANNVKIVKHVKMHREGKKYVCVSIYIYTHTVAFSGKACGLRVHKKCLASAYRGLDEIIVIFSIYVFKAKVYNFLFKTQCFLSLENIA